MKLLLLLILLSGAGSYYFYHLEQQQQADYVSQLAGLPTRYEAVSKENQKLLDKNELLSGNLSSLKAQKSNLEAQVHALPAAGAPASP